MKLSLFTIVSVVMVLTVTSCKKNQPAYTIEGTYSGAFNADQDTNTWAVSTGHQVKFTALTKNNVKCEGEGFDTFEFLVTSDGLNITRVNVSDTNLTKFTWVNDEQRIVFEYHKGDDWCWFNGTR
jgi:hypothetical protein